MSIQIGASLHSCGNEAFDHGVCYGIDFLREGDWPSVPPTSEQVIQFIKDNILEFQQEGWLDDTRMADLLGFLVGWIIGEYTTVREEKR